MEGDHESVKKMPSKPLYFPVTDLSRLSW